MRTLAFSRPSMLTLVALVLISAAPAAATPYAPMRVRLECRQTSGSGESALQLVSLVLDSPSPECYELTRLDHVRLVTSGVLEADGSVRLRHGVYVPAGVHYEELSSPQCRITRGSAPPVYRFRLDGTEVSVRVLSLQVASSSPPAAAPAAAFAPSRHHDADRHVCSHCGGSQVCQACHGKGNTPCGVCWGTGHCQKCEGKGSCWHCHGSGKNARGDDACSFCKGSGDCADCRGTGKCRDCKGTGIKSTCTVCNGTGKCYYCGH